jgi:hypothetical protein
MRLRLARSSAAILVIAAAGCSLVRNLDDLGNGLVADGGSEAAPLVEAGDDAQNMIGNDAAVDAPLEGDVDAATSYASMVLADHPVAYLRLGDPDLTVAKNERPSGDGHFVGATATVETPGLIAGDPDTAVRLQGKGRITLPLVPGLFIGTSPFTIEAWIAVDDTDGPLPTQWIVGREDVNNPRNGVSFLVDGAGVALERWQNQNASRVNGLNPRRGLPSHVLTTYDGTRIEVWVDGTPSGLGPSIQNVPDNAYATVAGAQSSQATSYFQGVIDEIALYDYALPADRIALHWRTGKGP